MARGVIEPHFQKDFSAGMVTNLNENLVPANTAHLLMNLDVDEEIGTAVSRLGTGIVGSQLVDGNTVLGLHDFRDTNGSNHALVAAINASGGASSVVYKVGTGTIRTGLTASLKMRFLTYLDSVLMVNGTDAEASYNGSTVITTGGAFDLANFPVNPHYIIEFLDRVYAAREGDDTLYYSSIPSSGSISWTSGNGSVEIEPEDGGGGIKGFGKVPNYLLIFKERSLKRFNFNSAFPESLVNIGTPSQESVVSAAGLCAFFSASSKEARGFYITNGGRPQPISHDRSRNIKKWVDAIPQSFEGNVAGFGNERFFAWSIGDVTVDGVSYTNVVVRWNRILDQWTVRSYPTEFRVFSSYVNSGVNAVVGGDDDGNVIEIDKASTYTDYPSTTPIHWEIQTQEEKFGYNQRKNITDRVFWDTKNAPQARSQIWADGEQYNANAKTDAVSRFLSYFLPTEIEGRRFVFGLKGTVNGARSYIKELEVPNITMTNNYE